MKLMWWDKILLIMTWGKTEEKPKALFFIRDNLQIHSLQEKLSKNGICVDEKFGC